MDYQVFVMDDIICPTPLHVSQKQEHSLVFILSSSHLSTLYLKSNL